MDDIRVYTGTLIADLRLPWSDSLKTRRRALRPILDRLRREKFGVAQVGPTELHQRVFLAITAVSGDSGVLEERLDAAEHILFRSEFEVGSVRRETRAWTGSSLA